MIYRDDWAEDDLLPDMDWCLQHGVEARIPPDDTEAYCWLCLSDSYKDTAGNVKIRCRVINLGKELKRRGRP